MAGDGEGKRPLVTVVCPVFNEEAAVPLFYQRLCAAIAPIEERVAFELLFVNNRSRDHTLDLLRDLQRQDARIQIITLSRNFGYQASITAGMRYASGDAVVNIDVDCEDPPELIPAFIEKWLAGADVAYGMRKQREEFVGMHLARKLFYRLTREVADHEIILDMAEFFLVDKRVRDAVLATRSTFPFVRGQVGYVGFRREGIRYKRGRRVVGKTHYNLRGAVRFAVAGILSSSTWALRVMMYLGLALFAASGIAAAWFLTTGAGLDVPPAVRTIGALLIVQAGWGSLGLGALAIYLARVYKDTMGLPLYVIDERTSSFRRPSHGG